MVGPEAARPSVGDNRLRASWLAALGVAFVGQLLAWSVSISETNGLVIVGAVIVGLVVGYATRGPWIAGAIGVVLASAVAGIGLSLLDANVYRGVVNDLVGLGVIIAIMLFTPAYLFGSAARPTSRELTPASDSPGQSHEGQATPKMGPSRRDRVRIGVLFVLIDAGLVAWFVNALLNRRASNVRRLGGRLPRMTMI